MAIYDESGRRAPVWRPSGYVPPRSTPATRGRAGGPSPLNRRRPQTPTSAPWSLAYLQSQQKAAQSRADFTSRYNRPDDTEPYYIGGYPESTAYALGGNLSFLRSRLGMQIPDQGVTVAKPKYIEGMNASFAARNRLTESQVAQWQAFFQLNGWKTGVYGVWGPQEISAMGDFMAMANGVTGGATVETLRDRIMGEIQNGRLGPGELADSLTGGTNASGREGAGEVGYEGPITETSTRTVITQASEADAMMLLRDVLTQRLGRAPAQGEIKSFLRDLNGKYRADPTVVTTTRISDAMAGTVQETTEQKESSVNPQAEAEMYGKAASPAEAANYQKLNIFNALMSELGL